MTDKHNSPGQTEQIHLTINGKAYDLQIRQGQKLVDLLRNTLEELVMQAYEKKEMQVGTDALRDIERRSMLEVVDDEWRDHLHEMDLLKEGVHLRAYANKDPLIEYKRESFDLFQAPARWMLWPVASLSILAGLTADAWSRPQGRALYLTRLGVAGSIAVFSGALIVTSPLSL